MPVNIIGVTTGSSIVTVSDNIVLDVDNCSDISSLSKILPSDCTGASDGGGLIYEEERYKVMEEVDCQVRKIFLVLQKLLSLQRQMFREQYLLIQL